MPYLFLEPPWRSLASHLDMEGPGKAHAIAIIAIVNQLLFDCAVSGGISYSFILDRWGRKVPIGAGSFFSVSGGAL